MIRRKISVYLDLKTAWYMFNEHLQIIIKTEKEVKTKNMSFFGTVITPLNVDLPVYVSNKVHVFSRDLGF